MSNDTAQTDGGRFPLREPSALSGAERTIYDDIIRDQKPGRTVPGSSCRSRREG
jgi:hypothetical protein